MFLCTTYFSNLRNLPLGITPVAICGKSPVGYKGLQYKKVAPKIGFFLEWKQNHDNDFYIEHFNREVLSTLNPNEIISDLLKLTNNHNIALVCYEKPSDFCHRHLVAEWLTAAGYPCVEFKKGVKYEL